MNVLPNANQQYGRSISSIPKSWRLKFSSAAFSEEKVDYDLLIQKHLHSFYPTKLFRSGKVW